MDLLPVEFHTFIKCGCGEESYILYDGDVISDKELEEREEYNQKEQFEFEILKEQVLPLREEASVLNEKILLSMRPFGMSGWLVTALEIFFVFFFLIIVPVELAMMYPGCIGRIILFNSSFLSLHIFAVFHQYAIKDTHSMKKAVTAMQNNHALKFLDGYNLNVIFFGNDNALKKELSKTSVQKNNYALSEKNGRSS